MTKITLSILFIFMGTISLSGQEYPPAELTAMEEKLIELQAEVSTLDEYAPKNFPEFGDLDRTSQIIERIDFNKRKFDLLIEQYNLIEDKIFPLFLSLSEKNPELRRRIQTNLVKYSDEGPLSIRQIQRNINTVAILIDRLKNELDRIKALAQAKDKAEEETTMTGKDGASVTISDRIQRLEEILQSRRQELTEEKARLAGLNEKRAAEEAKIEEKKIEREGLRKQAAESSDPVVRTVFTYLAQVRATRLNGLEIPRLNATKTFIYLSQTKIDTQLQQVDQIGKEIVSLRKKRRGQLQYMVMKGIAVILIAVLVVILLVKVTRRMGKKILKGLEASDDLDPHRKQRYTTLFSIIQSMIKIVLWVLAVLWVLGELNIDYAPFLVAAGGVSLAVGFGAQSLVKDVVSGFFILMEEQLALDDVVDIDGKTGTVEKISLRTIRIRSLSGTLHIIPNGSISRVSNLTHRWSRAVIEVGVSYDTDSRELLEVLKKVCEDLYRDPEWKDHLIGEPVPQGILSFGDSAVNFRILAKTTPGKQWDVDREMHIRVKEALDKAGIEIPYPYRNIVDRTPKPVRGSHEPA
jgi:small conductance mechanosensitive channel